MAILRERALHERGLVTGRFFRVSRRWMLIGAIFGIGVLVGWTLDGYFVTQPVAEFFRPVREQGASYQFINPLLTFDSAESDNIASFREIKQLLQTHISEDIAVGRATSISVYFRGVQSGRWVGVNVDEKYSPASLLKVPTMMAFFKLAEENPNILSRRIAYQGNYDDDKIQYFKPATPLQAGSYTIEALMRRMVELSDNVALRLLRENIPPAVLEKVYLDLGLPNPDTQEILGSMSVTEYSYFFRTLFNATYLNRRFSEQALGLLHETQFILGIRTGVPKNVPVATKFAERIVVARDGRTVQSIELHDCGIVYYPKHPYLLCVMTRGGNIQMLSNVIGDLSRVAYNERAKQFPQ